MRPHVMHLGPVQGTGREVKALWLAVVLHGPGDEGIPAILDEDGMMLPLLTSNKAAVPNLRRAAAQMARDSGLPVKVVRFTLRKELAKYEP